MDYRLFRSRRRTVSLCISEGQLVVRAPLRLPAPEIERFIALKQKWIQKHLQHSKAKAPAHAYNAGELFWYLGKQYPLLITDHFRSSVEFDGASFHLSRHKAMHGKSVFEKWYRQQAEKLLAERTRYYAGLMELSYKRITIKDANSRWGSCSSLGNINYSLRLVMAPLEVIDYVVVHELSHLKHQNHSSRFWELVGRFCPAYRSFRMWLKKNGQKLTY